MKDFVQKIVKESAEDIVREIVKDVARKTEKKLRVIEQKLSFYLVCITPRFGWR